MVEPGLLRGPVVGQDLAVPDRDKLCLTALQRPGLRVLPAGLGAPGEDPVAPLVTAPADVLWLDPFPGDPAELAESRWSLRLALVASLQYLPARQRAVFVLREVLSFPAGDVAEMLGTSVAAVKSALQRARARLDEVAPDVESLSEPDSPEARQILDRYMTAFENADIAALTDLLRDDARLEVVPMSPWLSGKRTCSPYLARHVLTAPGLYRMYPTIANGQPAAVAYRRDDTGDPFRPFGLAVLTTDATHLVSITTFLDPGWVVRFGFPGTPPVGAGTPVLPGGGA